jgi:hypothetical protein
LAFYSIAGIQQIIISVLIALILLEKIEITKQYLWVRGLAILLVFNFAFNFVIAVNSSTSTTYYNELFRDYIDQASSSTSGKLHDYIVALINMVNFV